MWRRLAAIAGAFVLLSGAGIWVALPQLVRSEVAARAELRGFSADVEGVTLLPGSLWLTGVTLKHARLPSFLARINAVRIAYGLGGVELIRVEGGKIVGREDLDALREAFKIDRPKATEPGVAREGGIPLEVVGIDADWSFGSGMQAWGWGLGLRRGEDRATWKVVADLLRFRADFALSEVTNLSARFHSPTRTISELGTGGVHVEVLVDQLRKLNEPAMAPGVRAVKPSGLVAGAGATGVVARLFSLDAERSLRLRARVDRLRALLRERVPAGTELVVENVTLRLIDTGAGVTVGPAKFSLKRQDELFSLRFTPGVAGDREHQLELGLRLPLTHGEVTLKLEGGPVTLGALGVREGDVGLTGVDATKLRVDALAHLSANSEELELSAVGALTGVSVEHPKVSPMRLSGIDVSWDGHAQVAVDGSLVRIEHAEVSLGDVKAQVKLSLERTEGRAQLHGQARIPSAFCQAMYQALPTGLVPQMRRTRLSGRFSFLAELDLDTDALEKTEVTWKMQNHCRFLAMPPELDPAQFARPFLLVVPDGSGVPMEFWTGPGSSNWSSISRVSRYLEIAVLVTEDGGFWRHRGFNQGAIASSIKQNIQAGKFVRGASTISMQLSKNLYLSRNKTLSRKVTEALLTMLLEQELRKDEILELYFNIIEYAPGVYGIQKAAYHYFRSLPEELSLAQCFFLASVLPNPKVNRFDEQGYLKPSRRAYLHRLMRIAHQRGRISAEELEQGLGEQLQFGVPHELRPFDPELEGWGF